jgi:hypothetical protein
MTRARGSSPPRRSRPPPATSSPPTATPTASPRHRQTRDQQVRRDQATSRPIPKVAGRQSRRSQHASPATTSAKPSPTSPPATTGRCSGTKPGSSPPSPARSPASASGASDADRTRSGTVDQTAEPAETPRSALRSDRANRGTIRSPSQSSTGEHTRTNRRSTGPAPPFDQISILHRKHAGQVVLRAGTVVAIDPVADG